MEAVESLFGPDSFYILVAIGVVLLTLLAFVGVKLIRGNRRPTDLLHTPPPRSPHESTLAGTAYPEALTDRLNAEPARPLQEIPADDAPADLATLPGGSSKVSPPPMPHTIEEIQRDRGKPLESALANTRSSFFGRIKSLFGSKPTFTPDELEQLEEILYTSDLGPQTVQRLLGAVEARVKSNGSEGFEAVRLALKDEMLMIFGTVDGALVTNEDTAEGRHLRVVETDQHSHHGSEDYIEGLEHLKIWDLKPAVLMVVGVNGAGKTTTIGKLASRIAKSGRKVLVAAGDTFRAAAGDQLKIWTERAQVEIFSPDGVTDPSAVAYQAVERAKSNGFDVVIIDTAGRLHTQKNLMEELKKMKRVLMKLIAEAPHETLLVLDANSGQNALIQAREFHQALTVTGVVLTKLDGSAKGGVAVGLAHELKLPIKLIGVGEGIDDLRRFSSQEFVDSII